MRCELQSNSAYPAYGARGIRVSPEWSQSYPVFREWAIANGYDDSLTIDRIDGKGNYCPENCRWVTNIDQQNNRSNNIQITAFGETKTAARWAADTRASVGERGILQRFKSGVPPEEAITKPSHRGVPH